VFEAVDSAVTSAGELPRLDVPEDGDYVVEAWVTASPQTPYSLSIGGVTDEQTRMSGMLGGGSAAVLVRPGADDVSVVVSDNYVADVTEAALVLYRRVE
jgi:hypothetical protein